MQPEPSRFPAGYACPAAPPSFTSSSAEDRSEPPPMQLSHSPRQSAPATSLHPARNSSSTKSRPPPRHTDSRQFLSPGGNIGATSTNTQGLGNAVATVASLANLTTGTSPGASFPAKRRIARRQDQLSRQPVEHLHCKASPLGCSPLFSATTPAAGPLRAIRWTPSSISSAIPEPTSAASTLSRPPAPPSLPR